MSHISLTDRGTTGPTDEPGDFFQTFNRGKRSLALDLKRPEGQEILDDLLTTADVLLEGFRPGVAERLGIGRDAVAARHPRVVYAAISGYGQTGPDHDVTGHDVSYVSRAAVVAPYVSVDDDTGFPLPLADLAAGALTAIGVLAALVERPSTGRGRYLDVSLAETVLSWVAPLAELRLNDRPIMAMKEPAYGVFSCGDGRSITLSIAFEDHFWRALCDTADLADLADLQASDRTSRTIELRERLQRALLADTAAGWVARLSAAGVPAGPVLGLGDVVGDAHFTARGIRRSAVDGHMRGVRRAKVLVSGLRVG